MKEIRDDNSCGRAEQLVGYLYGETTADERAGFEQHLTACVACREEVAAYGTVRTAVADWRAELLRDAPAVTLAEVLPPVEARPRTAGEPQRTPWGALREFFSLAPAWLRVASVAAALAVCALAALAVVNAEVRRENGHLTFSTGLWKRPAQTGATPQAAQPSQAELARLSAERDAALRELEDTRAQLETSRAANIEAVYQDVDESEALAPASPDVPREQTPVANRARRQNTAPPARGAASTRGRRTNRDEESLPRLLDLLGDAN